MGMTIEEALKEVNRVILCLTDGGNVTKEVNALEITMDTMRKYQKIEQIVSDFRKYQKGITWGFGGEKYMQMVSEVVEDGKID